MLFLVKKVYAQQWVSSSGCENSCTTSAFYYLAQPFSIEP
jgi:hypothetical protein